MTYCAKFSLGQFYVAKTRSYGRIVSGKILGNYNLSFAKNRQNESNLHQSSFSFFLNMAPPDVEGHKQKVVHLGCQKFFNKFFLVFLSQ